MRETSIPTFVIRGLATMANPADFSSVHYSTEAHLRDALAATWWLHGLVVQTEVDVPNCGRIDVMGRLGDTRLIVELKKTLTTPSQVRKAFSQAHAYKAFLDHDDHAARIHTTALVTCGSWDRDVVDTVSAPFVDVRFSDFLTAAHEPAHGWRLRESRHLLRDVSRARASLVADLSAGLRIADRNLATALELQEGLPA